MIFVINAGSSSVKFAVFDRAQPPSVIESGQASVRDGEVTVSGTLSNGDSFSLPGWSLDTEHDRVSLLLEAVAETLSKQFQNAPDAVVHRVVHGGSTFREPVRVTEPVRDALESLVDLAPLHQPVNLAGIDVFAELYPDTPQIACFDTAFHFGQSPLETHFALPEHLFEQGVRKYGFHGLSYAYIASELPRYGVSDTDRVIVCHLGNGASLCAIQAGQSVASTMGFTALDGLPMGTRAGRLDAGVVLHLIDQLGWTVEEVEHLLYHDSGLKGLSGISSDVRTLEASTDPRAAFALAYFSYRIQAEIGALVAILGGLDVLVFTAGIGEHSMQIRSRVCEGLSRWWPVELDASANEAQSETLHTDRSRVRVLRLPTDENLWMAMSASAHCL